MSKPVNFISRFALSRRHHEVQPRRHASTSPQRSSPLPRPALAMTPRNLKPFNDIPGPLALPMLRHSAHVLPSIGNFHHKVGVGLLEGMRQKYGDLVRLAKASRKRPVLYVFDPDMMMEVYESRATQSPRWERSPLATQRSSEHNGCPMHGNGNHNIWPAIQDILQDRRFLECYNEAFADIANDATKRLGELRFAENALNEELETEVYRWALESIGMLIFGIRLGCLDGPVHVPTTNNKRSHRTSMDDDALEPCSLSKRCLSELTYAERLVRCTQEIAEGSYMVRSESTLKPSSDTYRKAVQAFQQHHRLMDIFLQKSVEDLSSVPLRPEQLLLKQLLPLGNGLLPLASDFFLAGVDSLVDTSLSTLYALSVYPAQQQRAHDEVRYREAAACAGAVAPRPQYARACVTEAMRLFPRTSGVVRRATCGIAVGGYDVPAGVDIVLAHGVLSRSEQHWPRAGSFIPERWCDECIQPLRATRAHPMATLPFGEHCPFSNTAETMLEALTTSIVDKYRVEWHGPTPMLPKLHKPHYFVLQQAA